MNAILPLAGAALAGLAGWMASRGLVKKSRARRALRDAVNLFSPDFFLADDGSAAMAADKKSGQILLVQADLNQQILKFEDILSVRLDEDDRLVTATRLSGSRGLTIEVLDQCLSSADASREAEAGGQEALPTGDLAHNLRLTLAVAAPRTPVFTLYFLRRGRGLSRSSQEYLQARTQAERWCVLFQVRIQQADEDERRREALGTAPAS